MAVYLPPLIADGMVLQRDARVTLWGRADEPISVAFQGQTRQAAPDADGRWSVCLEDLAPGGPYTLRINERLLRDVYVGDVWICAGQSNMQLSMQRVRHRYPSAMEDENPAIRQFAVPERYDFRAPAEELDGGAWLGATRESIPDFSAVGFFFARELHARYGVPIGLLQTAVGGTPIHSWMSREALAAFPALLKRADSFADDAHIAAVQEKNESNARRYWDALDGSDPGLKEGWRLPDYDDSGWEPRPLTEPWTGTGSVWLRKTLDIPPSLAGLPATLFLGTVRDWDMAYVNGEPVGSTAYRYPPREYIIPALPEGKMTLALRVVGNNGGGFTHGKPYHLATQNGSIPLGGEWRFRRGATAEPPIPDTVVAYQPVGLYHGMIAPLARYAARGVIWYQGEGDTARPERYAQKYAAMVRDWRKRWGMPLPFLSVELAYWEGGPTWDLLRAEQWEALAVEGTAMAAAADLGEYNDLHPQGKRAVAERLARCAMRVAYGETLPPSPFEVVFPH